ncbi:MAG: heavy metal translocating P-type ATPase metal-binding domain-containing protein [Verrucomicrobiota bacterium]
MFCCSGCSYVYRMIHESGLEKCYDYRDETIEPVGSRAFPEHDFSELAEWQESLEFNQTTEIIEGELSLQGISCAGCVRLVERIFQKQAGAINIQIEVSSGYVLIRWQRGLFRVDKMAREVAQFAYIFEYKEISIVGDCLSAPLAFQTAGLQGAAILQSSQLPENAAFYFSGQGLGGIASPFEAAEAMIRIRSRMFRLSKCLWSHCAHCWIFWHATPLWRRLSDVDESVITTIVAGRFRTSIS